MMYNNTIYSICLIYDQEYRKRFLKKYINFTLLPQNYFPFGRVAMKFIIFHLLPLQILQPNLVKNSPVISEKKMMHDGRQP